MQVWCVSSVDVELQIRKLLDQNQFQLALKLTSLSDATDEEKAKRTYKIQTLYAHHLFCSKKFQEAMKQFHELGTDPYEVIRLFPHLVSDSSGCNSNDGNESMATGLPKLQDRDLENGLLALIGFLTEVRHNLMGGTDGKDSKDNMKNDRDKKSMTAAATEQLLKIIDTTLLKCYLQVTPEFVTVL